MGKVGENIPATPSAQNFEAAGPQESFPRPQRHAGQELPPVISRDWPVRTSSREKENQEHRHSKRQHLQQRDQ